MSAWYPHIHIDIETLGIEPGAAIYQIALVIVKDQDTPPEEMECLKLNVIPTSPLNAEDGALIFTLKNLFNGGQLAGEGYELVTESQVRGSITNWLVSRGINGKGVCWYANGSDFDFTRMTARFPNLDLWRYNLVRDLRTMVNDAREMGLEIQWPKRTAQYHTAYADCITQITVFQDITQQLRELRGRKTDSEKESEKEDREKNEQAKYFQAIINEKNERIGNLYERIRRLDNKNGSDPG